MYTRKDATRGCPGSPPWDHTFTAGALARRFLKCSRIVQPTVCTQQRHPPSPSLDVCNPQNQISSALISCASGVGSVHTTVSKPITTEQHSFLPQKARLLSFIYLFSLLSSPPPLNPCCRKQAVLILSGSLHPPVCGSAGKIWPFQRWNPVYLRFLLGIRGALGLLLVCHMDTGRAADHICIHESRRDVHKFGRLTLMSDNFFFLSSSSSSHLSQILLCERIKWSEILTHACTQTRCHTLAHAGTHT